MFYGKGRQRKPKISKLYLFCQVKSKCIIDQVSKASQNFQVIILPNQILMYFSVSNQSKPKNFKQYLFYPVKNKCIIEQASKASQKFSSNTCFASSNLKVIQCNQAKQAKNYLFYPVLKFSSNTCFAKSNLNVFQCNQSNHIFLVHTSSARIFFSQKVLILIRQI